MLFIFIGSNFSTFFFLFENWQIHHFGARSTVIKFVETMYHFIILKSWTAIQSIVFWFILKSEKIEKYKLSK